MSVAEDIGLDQIGMPISSDTIESLFGVSKQHGCAEIKDANRIALRIPAMCGELTSEEAQMVLDISVKEQREIEAPLASLTKQRRDILPNPGRLDAVVSTQARKNLELIPGSKKRSKNKAWLLHLYRNYLKSLQSIMCIVNFSQVGLEMGFAPLS